MCDTAEIPDVTRSPMIKIICGPSTGFLPHEAPSYDGGELALLAVRHAAGTRRSSRLRVAFVAVTMPPHWRPRSEADIQRAIEDGLLSETHYLDCKREIGDTPGERKETARDLASFAIDGGALLIGVGEDKASRIFTLSPQPLSGLGERVENIAGAIIDPGLDVVPQEIESEIHQGAGHLVVEVRPSPFAPHMVDGVYYGRGEKKRIRLTDAQVLRRHAQRVGVEEGTQRMLDAEVARDPVPAELRKLGHLYLVARPLTAPPTIARQLVRQAGPVPLKQIAGAAEQHLGRWGQQPPSATDATRYHRRARGVALSSLYASGPGRTFANYDSRAERHLVDIEFGEDGSIRALVGSATFQQAPDYLLSSFWPGIAANRTNPIGWERPLLGGNWLVSSSRRRARTGFLPRPRRSRWPIR